MADGAQDGVGVTCVPGDGGDELGTAVLVKGSKAQEEVDAVTSWALWSCDVVGRIGDVESTNCKHSVLGLCAVG